MKSGTPHICYIMISTPNLLWYFLISAKLSGNPFEERVVPLFLWYSLLLLGFCPFLCLTDFISGPDNDLRLEDAALPIDPKSQILGQFSLNVSPPKNPILQRRTSNFNCCKKMCDRPTLRPTPPRLERVKFCTKDFRSNLEWENMVFSWNLWLQLYSGGYFGPTFYTFLWGKWVLGVVGISA